MRRIWEPCSFVGQQGVCTVCFPTFYIFMYPHIQIAVSVDAAHHSVRFKHSARVPAKCGCMSLAAICCLASALTRCVSSVGCALGGLKHTSSCGSGGDELEARFLYVMVRTLLMAARSLTSSGSYSGFTHGICMIRSLTIVYSAQSARVNRARMMSSRSGGLRESRSWHDTACGT